MKSPKKVWQEDAARVLAVSEALARPEMEAAIQTAFAELCHRMPRTDNPAIAGIAAYRIEGARAGFEILCSLHTKHIEPKTPTHNLTHDNPGTQPPTQKL